MAYDLIIRNGQVVTARDVARASIAVTGEKIVEIAADISGTAGEEIDATGLHVFPGLIDPHVHFNEPGRTEWEGIATGSAALAAGGGTCFFDMPLNSAPPVLDGKRFDAKLAAAREKSLADFALWGGLTPGNLDRLEELAARGVIGFKAFMSGSGIGDFPRADDQTLRRGMTIARQLGLTVAVHAEDDATIEGLTEERLREGKTGIGDYLDSRPEIAEDIAIARAIELAAETNCDLHVVHVSTWRGVDRVREAQARGLPVTCETCPHYLLLCDQDLLRIGAAAKCAPPLRTEAVRDRLWDCLEREHVQFVASDHSPAPECMKQDANFFKVWGGISGVQSTRAALLSRFPKLPLPLIARLTSANVADRFKVAEKGEISVGFDADLSLVDVEAERELTRETLFDRHRLSPYVGWTFRGVVRRTILRGTTIFRDGRIVSKPIGRLVRPA